ncbi:hypothetical protein ES708_30941 [subsurface metagenome]
MAHGYPDFAPVAGEVLGGKAYETYTFQGGLNVPSGAYTISVLEPIPEGLEVYQSIGIISAKGCDFVHAIALYINDTLIRYSYFEVESAITYPRHYIAREGDVMTLEFYNYDAVTRHFLWSAIGILLTVGTKPLTPRHDPGPLPRCQKDEIPGLINDTIFGKRWVKAKQHPIVEFPDAVLRHAKGQEGKG